MSQGKKVNRTLSPTLSVRTSSKGRDGPVRVSLKVRNRLVNELTDIIKELPNETLQELITKYTKSHKIQESDELFFVNYRLLGTTEDTEELFILEYVDGEYKKVMEQSFVGSIIDSSVVIVDGKPQFITHDDSGTLYRWIYDGKEFKSHKTAIKEGDATFLDKNGDIIVFDDAFRRRYSKGGGLVVKVENDLGFPIGDIYPLPNNTILVVGGYPVDNQIYDTKTLKSLGIVKIKGEDIKQINLDTFIDDIDVFRYSSSRKKLFLVSQIKKSS